MESITKQLVNIGHGMSKEIAADEPAVAKLLVELSSSLDVQYERGNALEAKCAALAAENAGLKAGITYFAYSPDYGFDYFKDKQSAIDTAQDEIDAYREDAEDGWSEDVQRVSWGVVVQQAQGVDAHGLHTSDSQHTYQTCNYRLVDAVETPATDAFLAEVRAQGVDVAIEHLINKFEGTGRIGVPVMALEWLSKELRKGGQQ
ncbi:TPA: hypothetical protein ACQ7WR_002116 [Escherichia coli]|uniref:hypothetical protein n=1 Tax=Escherichia coli TaxID=562 RepID=UPI001D0BF613|nr:hypothetical protein [Escherichia coli]EMD4022574.1 hypothetical protein [Escherichia coli]